MKAYFSIIIFAVLVLSSVVAGTDSYMEARGRIASDLDRALAKALAEKGQEWITADTVRVCRQLGASSSDGVAMLLRDEYFDKSLSIPELRGRSYVSLTVLDEGETVDMICRDVAGICGDTMVVSPVEDNVAGVRVAVRGNVECSFATVLELSDQKLPLALWTAALLWGMLSFYYVRKPRVHAMACEDFCRIGDISYDKSARVFYDMQHNELRLTPMQLTLMEMFVNAEDHRLTKVEICEALWPGKDDANETLYTLIRRLKQVVGQSSNLRIETERGRAYRLTSNCL